MKDAMLLRKNDTIRPRVLILFSSHSPLETVRPRMKRGPYLLTHLGTKLREKLITMLIEQRNQVLRDDLGRAAFDLVALHHTHQLTILEKGDGR
ncbi:MAG: hypothetical protein JWQ78_1187 [Sediminibacterium sp.]|nr:hypothetical protein [Sediminibacterium sp.]